MHEENILLLKKDVIKLAQNRIHILNEAELLFNSFDEIPILNDIKSYKKILLNEIDKVNNFELVLAVVGTMKSGKSTVINALVGYELLPNRDLPMTTIPTIITHKEGQKVPQMEFSYNEIIKKTQNDLKKISPNKIFNKKHINIDEIINFNFSDRIEGAENIKKALTIINDMLRICSENSLDFSVESFDTINRLPRIIVHFESLPEHNGNKIGKFSIVDTPGINEANHREKLKQIFKQQINMASSVLFVMDFTQFNSEATQELKDDVHKILDIAKDKIIVLVNKFDQKNQNTMDENETKKYVSEVLFENKIPYEKIFPSSAFYAFLCNNMKKKISLNNKKPDINENWVKDFIKKTYGDTDFADDDYQREDIERLMKRIDSFYTKSKFNDILNSTVTVLNNISHITSIESMLEKLEHFNCETKKDIEFYYPLNILKIKEESLKNTIDNLNIIIAHLKNDIDKVEKLEKVINNDVNKLIYNTTTEINIECKNKFEHAIKSVDNIFNKAINELEKIESDKETNNKSNFLLINIFHFISRNNTINNLKVLFKNGEICTESEDMTRNIKDWITIEYNRISYSLRDTIADIFKKRIAGMEQNINKIITKEIESIKLSVADELKERNFFIDLESLNLPKEVNYDLSSNLNSNIVKIKTEKGGWYDKEGIIAAIGRIFDQNNKWGWGREYKPNKYIFIKKEILKSIQTNLICIKENIFKENRTIIENQIKPPLNDYFISFKSKLEELRNILISSVKYKQEKEKIEIDNSLKEIKKKIKGIKDDKDYIELCNKILNSANNI